MPRRSLALPLALLVFAGAALAATSSASEPVDALIERSGLADQLTNFEASMQTGIDAAIVAQRGLTKEEVERLHRAVAGAYAPGSLRPVLRSELAKRLNPKEIAAALAWIDSPVGRKLAALEAKATTPEAQRRIESAARGDVPELTPARAQTLHALIRATRADEVGASILMETGTRIWEGSWNASPEHVAFLRRELEARRGEIVAEMHQRSFGAFSVVYASASDAELAALLAFARSPVGAKYHAASASAFESTLAQAARRLGGALAVPAAPASN